MMSFFVVPVRGLAWTLERYGTSTNTIVVSNTGGVVIKLNEVRANPTTIMTTPHGQLRGSFNSNFSSPYDDWYSSPAYMNIDVPVGSKYYFRFVNDWVSGNIVTVKITDADYNNAAEKTLTNTWG